MGTCLSKAETKTEKTENYHVEEPTMSLMQHEIAAKAKNDFRGSSQRELVNTAANPELCHDIASSLLRSSRCESSVGTQKPDHVVSPGVFVPKIDFDSLFKWDGDMEQARKAFDNFSRTLDEFKRFLESDDSELDPEWSRQEKLKEAQLQKEASLQEAGNTTRTEDLGDSTEAEVSPSADECDHRMKKVMLKIRTSRPSFRKPQKSKSSSSVDSQSITSNNSSKLLEDDENIHETACVCDDEKEDLSNSVNEKGESSDSTNEKELLTVESSGVIISRSLHEESDEEHNVSESCTLNTARNSLINPTGDIIADQIESCAQTANEHDGMMPSDSATLEANVKSQNLGEDSRKSESDCEEDNRESSRKVSGRKIQKKKKRKMGCLPSCLRAQTD